MVNKQRSLKALVTMNVRGSTLPVESRTRVQV